MTDTSEVSSEVSIETIDLTEVEVCVAGSVTLRNGEETSFDTEVTIDIEDALDDSEDVENYPYKQVDD